MRKSRFQKKFAQRIQTDNGFFFPPLIIKFAAVRVQSRFLSLLLFFSLACLTVASSLNSGDKYDPTTLVFPPFFHVWVQKANAKQLQWYTKNQVKVFDPQGIAATLLDNRNDPKRSADDAQLTVYGVNSGYDMIIYNTSLSSLSFYGINEKGERRLNRPRGITAHRGGDVYLADTGNNRVVHFFNPRKELKWVRALGGMSTPQDVTISADRTVFVADTGNNRVLVFRDDKLAQSWDNLSSPSGIAATDSTEQWSYYKDNFIIVLDRGGQRLQKFTRDGRLLKVVTAAEIGKPNARFMYAAIDYYSNIFVTDFNNHCVHKFDRELNFLISFGRMGGGDKEFIEPRGISIYRRFGQVLVDDRESAQYYWIGTDVLNPRAARHAEHASCVQLDYFLTEASYVTLEVLDADAKVLAKPMDKTLRFSGGHQEIFGGRWEPVAAAWIDNQRRYDAKALQKMLPVPAGKYVLRLTISATYSSYKYFAKTIETAVEL
jgi:hypothetical protein